MGSLSSYGPQRLELQERFFARLGLRSPTIVWNAARDVVAEWFQVLTLITGSGDKFGHEVYNLQRSEIGEVSEGFGPGTVGSITMPHKRNPDIAEHLGTLARIVRHNTAMYAHEDGRSLEQAILENETIRAHLSDAKIASLFDYRQAVGLCPEFVDRVVNAAKEE